MAGATEARFLEYLQEGFWIGFEHSYGAQNNELLRHQMSISV